MKHPKYMDMDTAQIWMWHRRKGNPDWIMKGLIFLQTDSRGFYEDIRIRTAFELHVAEKQLVVLYHPDCMKQEEKFLAKVRKELESIYENLKDRF